MSLVTNHESNLEQNPNVSSTGDDLPSKIVRVSSSDDDDDVVVIDRMGDPDGASKPAEEKVGDVNLNVAAESKVFNSSVKEDDGGESRVFEGLHSRSERGEARVLSQSMGGGDAEGENSVRSLLPDAPSVKEKMKASLGSDGFGAAAQGLESEGSEVSMPPPSLARVKGNSSQMRPPMRGKSTEYERYHAPHLDAETKDVGYGFQMGDMVWGKVKSHPWWPGHIFNEAFAFPSVRRAKRDGHVLVAFFGDSSYGWFDPAELLPYEPYFSEKSRQTNSRGFLKAVEESVDEASRRSALGLSCRCGDPSNFRPTICKGYLAVDVADYEAGGIYSVSQIHKAREECKPAKTLSFIKQLAEAPRSAESGNLDFIKDKAAALALRKAIYVDFDPTYAQAFGQQPVAPSRLPPEPPRVPLSGPLVIAEALGGQKSSTKPPKSREYAKKDRYLFKRRDERREFKTPQRQTSSSSSSACEDGPSDSVAGDYVLQRRDESVFVERGLTSVRSEVAASSVAIEEAVTETSSTEKQQIVAIDESRKVETDASAVPTKVAGSDGSGRMSGELGGKTGASGGPAKKIKAALKRPAGEISTQQSDLGEKKKKKKRKTDPMKGADQLSKHTSAGEVKSVSKLAGNSVEHVISSREDSQLTVQKMPDQVLNPSSSAGPGSVELSKFLSDLRGLAMNHFHGGATNRLAVVRQIFLRFRSLVYQKSLLLSPPVESESNGAQPARIEPAAVVRTPADKVRGMHSSKPLKPLARTDESTSGQKRLYRSERQEEIASKKAKRLMDAKSSASEKRLIQKTPESQRAADGKVKASTTPSRSAKGEHVRRVEAPPKVEEPTYLIMKYPLGSSLPSSTELKARFARFGPMDISATRVFYKSSTCRIVFLYRQDAETAYKYALGNKAVFSGVRFLVKAVDMPEGRGDDGLSEQPRNRESAADPRSGAHPLQQPIQASAIQLKPCLKRPAGDEVGQGAGNARGARVRFSMGEDSGVRGVHLMEGRNNSSFPDSGPSPVAMDVSSSNETVISAQHPLPPLLPVPPQFPRLPVSTNQQHIEVAQGSNQNNNLAPAAQPSQAPQPDISRQMMILLMRCHDVVSNMRSILGYVPYHPL